MLVDFIGMRVIMDIITIYNIYMTIMIDRCVNAVLYFTTCFGIKWYICTNTNII